jgi:hypothetical protein
VETGGTLIAHYALMLYSEIVALLRKTQGSSGRGNRFYVPCIRVPNINAHEIVGNGRGGDKTHALRELSVAKQG